MPENLLDLDFDYICITSKKYFQEIKSKVEKLIGEENKDKIVSVYELFGNFRNEDVRNQWVIDQISKIPEGNILLDAGAGEQKYRPYCSHLKYIAQDFGKFIPNETSVGLSQDISWDYTGINITRDIVDMPLVDESVDTVLCTEVFEHLRDYGFEIRDYVINGNYFKYLCQELFRVVDMAQRYCEVKLNPEELNTICDSMDIMTRLSEEDKGSDETLCFGKMLTAIKNGG